MNNHFTVLINTLIISAIIFSISLILLNENAYALTSGGIQTQQKSNQLYLLTNINNGFSCSYNKNGLIAKSKTTEMKKTYKYNGTRLDSVHTEFIKSKDSMDSKFYYKNGRIYKNISKRGSEKVTTSYKYNSKGFITQVKSKSNRFKYLTVRYSYYKNGRIKTSNNGVSKQTYIYDENGYLKKITCVAGDEISIMKFKNKYDSNKNLIKQSGLSENGYNNGTEKFKYIKKNIKLKYLDLVRFEQDSLFGFTPIGF